LSDRRDRSFSYRGLVLLGCGFMGIQLLWSIYNAYVPIFLQVGRADYSTTAGVPHGYALQPSTTSLILTLDNWTGLVMLPLVAAFSDRVWTRIGRRKPFILAGAPIGAIGFVAIPLVLGGPLPLFMAALATTFLAMNMFRSPTVALMPDVTPSTHRSAGNGIINLMGGVGQTFGFFFGGVIFAVSYAAPFWLGAAGLLVGTGLVLLFIREPRVEPDADSAPADPDPEAPASLIRALAQVIRDRDRSALRILGAIFSWYMGHTAIEVFFTSFAINELGADSGQATASLSFFSFSFLAFALVAGWLGQRFGRRRVILTAIAALAVLYMMVGTQVQTLPQARALLVAAGVCWSVMIVNSLPMVVDCAPRSRIGTYTGLYYVATQSASIVGPYAAGWIVQLSGNSYRIMYPYAAGALILAGLSMWGVRRGEARH
jgi:maltose/moltooligosaccharide transporter